MTRKHRGITAFLPVLLLGLIGPLRVQGQEMVKVGVLHVARAIFESEEGKTEMADLQKKVDAKQEEFAKQQKEIQDLQAQIQRQGATLNQEAQAALARNLENKQIFSSGRPKTLRSNSINCVRIFSTGSAER